MPQLNGNNNVFLTNDMIAQEALRLLKNNMVYGRIASRRYQGEFADVGATVNVQLPARTKSAAGRVLVIQPMVKKTVPIVVNQQQHVGVAWTAVDKTLSMGDFSDQFLKSGVTQLANVIDLSVGQTILDSSFYQYGTPGSAITQDTLINAKAQAILTGMPDDGMLTAVLDPRDGASIDIALSAKYNPQFVQESIVKGYMGNIADIELYRSANAPTHLTGTFTAGSTPLTNSATAQTGASLLTKGWANSTAIFKKGDTFSIAGVFSVNPQSYASTGILQQFTVLADVSSDGAGLATVSISPAINDGTLTSLDGAGNAVSTKAYQNVSVAAANNAALVPVGTQATRYRYAPIFHRDAVALVVPALRQMDTAVVSKVMTDPDTGISISMTGGYDVVNHSETYRLDVIWGVAAVYPELIERVISAST